MLEFDWDGIDCFESDTERYRETVELAKQWAKVLKWPEPMDQDLTDKKWRAKLQREVSKTEEFGRNDIIAAEVVVIKYLEDLQCGVCHEGMSRTNSYTFSPRTPLTWDDIYRKVSCFSHRWYGDCLVIEELSSD